MPEEVHQPDESWIEWTPALPPPPPPTPCVAPPPGPADTETPGPSSERKRRRSSEDTHSSMQRLESDLDTGPKEVYTTPRSFPSDFDLEVKERKKFVRRKWSDEEQAAVFRHLGHLIEAQILPGRSAIDACKRAELVLENRTWRNIKDFCRNSMQTKR